jgi:hypothetical protein
MYYTKDAKRTFVPQTHKDRFAVWLRKLSDHRTGIPEPTAEELAAVYAKPCRYRRAARASRT